jgi:hypothetical protein
MQQERRFLFSNSLVGNHDNDHFVNLAASMATCFLSKLLLTACKGISVKIDVGA